MSDIFNNEKMKREAKRRKRISELQARINSLEGEIEGLNGEIESLSGEITILEEKKAKYIELINGIENAKEELSKAVKGLNSTGEQLRSSCTGDVANAASSSMENSISGISQISTKLESIKNTAIGKRNTISLNLENKIQQLEVMNVNLKGMRKTLGELQAELASI